MALGSLNGVIPRLRQTVLAVQTTASDADLLDRYVTLRDPDAFETLVRRHGPMVFAACRRILRRVHDAEDAFQATFLVLAYKAAAVSPRSKLAGWLHGVASRTALKARHRALRQSAIESRATTRSRDEMLDQTCVDAEPLLDQELAGLPDRYRLPIILCDLEGRLRSEVANTLGCSEGTLSSRLTRGRRLLAERLQSRGVQLSVAAMLGILATKSKAVAESLVQATIPVALAPVSVVSISPTVAQLASGVLKIMLLKKLQTVGAAMLVALAAVIGLSSSFLPESKAAPVPKTPAAPAIDEKELNAAIAEVDAHLLLNRKVFKDMKCDIDQLDKIMDKMEEAQKKSFEKTQEAMMAMKQNSGGGGANPNAFEQMIKDANETGAKELRKAVAEVATEMLTVEQRVRLRQIDLQARGPLAFTLPSVAKDLNLTAKQKVEMAENVKKIEEDVQQAFQKPLVIGGGGGGVITVNSDTVNKEAYAEGMKRAMAKLTEEQQAAWKKLIGEPIKYELPIRRNHSFGGFGFGGGARVFPGGGNVIPLPAPIPIGPNGAVPNVVVPANPGK